MAPKHKKPGAKNPDIFNKPMDNPFNEYVQSPAPKEGQEKPPLDKPMENPFKGIERAETSPSAGTIPRRKGEIAHATMPPRREVPYDPAKAEQNPGPGNATLVKQKKKTA